MKTRLWHFRRIPRSALSYLARINFVCHKIVCVRLLSAPLFSTPAFTAFPTDCCTNGCCARI